MLWCLQDLEDLTLQQAGMTNPVCSSGGYRAAVWRAVPKLQLLDGTGPPALPGRVLNADYVVEVGSIMGRATLKGALLGKRQACFTSS